MKILKTELHRAIISRKFLVSICIGIITQIIASFLMTKNVIIQYIVGGVEVDALNNMLDKYSLWYFSTNIYVFIIPLIACIPYTTSLLTDEKSRYIIFIKNRVSYKKYIFSKIFSCFVSGFLAVFISSTIFFIIISLSPYSNPNPSINLSGFMSSIYDSNKNLYLFFYFIICSFMGGTYSLISLAISTKIDNLLIVLITPTIYYYVGTFIFGSLGFVCLEPATVNAFFVRPNVNGIYILAQLMFLIIITIYMIIKRTNKGELKCLKM